ncbi:hypothetical protein [Corallococcus terminator]|uniref:hypothetical protein n=1 Tax=Corallococcus terminator TaxID=2316733 RepID=UPI00131536C2|nr:hypothetical protein [Corallococcus terminator]
MKERLLAALAASGFFIIACVMPAMTVAAVGTTSREREMSGLEILLTGWMGAVEMNFGWYANPLLGVALLLLLIGKDRPTLWVGTSAALVGLSSLTWFVHPLPSYDGGASVNELLYPSVGFFCWMISLCIAPLTALELASRSKASVPTPAPEPTP